MLPWSTESYYFKGNRSGKFQNNCQEIKKSKNIVAYLVKTAGRCTGVWSGKSQSAVEYITGISIQNFEEYGRNELY